MPTPLESYEIDCQRSDFVADEAQRQAVLALDDLYHRLIKLQEPTRGWRFRRQAIVPEKGLYMWGGVGRGKTYLMDTFFEALPFKEKKRLHFHRFMQLVHHELRNRQGQKNPLEAIATDFAKDARVLCLDEFFVTDITDAMLLGGLLTALFARGTALVTTSNIEPDGLYANGLQRARFLPAIEQLKQHTQVLNVDGGVDFRHRQLTLTERYLCPLDQQADHFMESWFTQLSAGQAVERDTETRIEGRLLPVVALADDVAWFEFRTLCDGPRSQSDYIALAKCFDTVLLANVEPMSADGDDIARRFINLVDEFYDSGVKLIITSDVPITDLYRNGGLVFEFQRTESRLTEMQSREYLGHVKR